MPQILEVSLLTIEQAREANDSTYTDLVGDEEGLEDIDISSDDDEQKTEEGIVEQIETPILRNRLGDSAGVFGAAWIGV